MLSKPDHNVSIKRIWEIFIMPPKIRFRILGQPLRRPKDKAAGDFETQAYITNTVRRKIAENAVFRDVLTVVNPAKAGFGCH